MNVENPVRKPNSRALTGMIRSVGASPAELLANCHFVVR